MVRKIELNVNGTHHTVETTPERSLLHVLREDLDLTGTKYGCGEGQCGACTVLIAGKPTRSCITPAETVSGKPITTIEGVEQKGQLHPVQEAFLAEGAMQCGYCTSGMILAGVALLSQNAHPSEAEIIHAMQGNICRCGTYPRIVAAVSRASKAGRSQKP